jgi:hypothetical protein
MAKSLLYDYSATPASNTDIDGLDSTGATGLVKSGDNYTRSMMSHLAKFADDLGGVNTVGGIATAVTVTLAQGFTAYGTGDGEIGNGTVIALKMSVAATGAATLNVNTIGTKKIRRQGDAAIEANDWIANGIYFFRYDTAYDSATGAWVLMNPASAAPTFATNAQAVTGTSTVLSVNPAGLAFATSGYATTATAAGTTTLTVASEPQQYFTGTTTQTVALPVTSTLNFGRPFRIVNLSTGVVTIQSSGGNTVVTVPPMSQVIVTCILTSGTTAASWSSEAQPLVYERGTTTPTVTATSGSFTTVACALSYERRGNLVTFTAVVTITNAGTAVGNLSIPLPITAASGAAVAGWESQATGFTCNGAIISPFTNAVVAKYDSTTIIGSGRTVSVTGSYFV